MHWHYGSSAFLVFLGNVLVGVVCARSSVGLERLTTDQEAGGSSPSGRVHILGLYT